MHVFIINVQLHQLNHQWRTLNQLGMTYANYNYLLTNPLLQVTVPVLILQKACLYAHLYSLEVQFNIILF